MRQPDNVAAVAALYPDFMGFIFYDQSKRFVGKDFVLPQLPDTVAPVAVTVNLSAEDNISLALKHGFKYLQLHGDESPETVEKVRSKGLRVIKAIGIATEEDLKKAAHYQNTADYILFDTQSRGYGGTGRSFDWALLQAYKGPKPYFLSGGIRLEDAAKISTLSASDDRFFAVDVNSGFEIAPALKNPENLASFISILRHGSVSV